MKRDLENWVTMPAGAAVLQDGVANVTLSSPSALYAEAEDTGQIVLIGYGDKFKLTFKGVWKFSTDVVAAYYQTPTNRVEQSEVIFTNLDIRVEESESVRRVNGALRMLKLQQQAANREMSENMRQLRAAKREAALTEEEREELREQRRKAREEREAKDKLVAEELEAAAAAAAKESEENGDE